MWPPNSNISASRRDVSLLLFACAFDNMIRARNLNSLFCFTPNAIFILEKRGLKNSRFPPALRYSIHDFNFRCLWTQNGSKNARLFMLSLDAKFSVGSLCLQMTRALFVLATFCSSYRYAVLAVSRCHCTQGGAFTSRRIFRPSSLSDLVFRLSIFFSPLCLCSYLAFAGYRETSRRCASRECRNKPIFT